MPHFFAYCNRFKTFYSKLLPLWWNWQTRGTQNPVMATSCGFDPHQRHQKNPIAFLRLGFLITFGYRLRSAFAKKALQKSSQFEHSENSVAYIQTYTFLYTT